MRGDSSAWRFSICLGEFGEMNAAMGACGTESRCRCYVCNYRNYSRLRIMPDHVLRIIDIAQYGE